MDPKPFQAQVDAQQAAMQRNQASLQVASANLARTKPLAAQNALSQKDLDDAQGQYEQAAAAVAQSKAQLEEAQLNLSYTTITSPVTGVSSFAAVADGTYLSPQNSQLTTVSVLTPMWINFSVSENEMQRIRSEVKSGMLKLPENLSFTVDIELIDGTLFPYTGRITFADPSYNSQTGTFLIRASVDNPQGILRPNQYVRTRLNGAARPNAILVPQRAVQQGAKGHFVWVVNKQQQAELRPVARRRVVQRQLVHRARPGERRPGRRRRRDPARAGCAGQGHAVRRPQDGDARWPRAIAGQPQPQRRPPRWCTSPAARRRSTPRPSKVIATTAKSLMGLASTIIVTGYTDKTGGADANVELAQRRALAVRDAFIKAGIPAAAHPPAAATQVTGSGSDADARRVDIAVVR